MSDTIYRQDAIDAAMQYCSDDDGTCSKADEDIRNLLDELEDLPPAQPEPLTDKEQRIFLAAMRREEEVCKQVDDECRNCREPYENSLVRTCREITRKVKGALWMIQSADKLQ